VNAQPPDLCCHTRRACRVVPLVLSGILLSLSLAGCTPSEQTPATPALSAHEQLFQEITFDAGLNVRHFSGPTKDYPMPQSIGSGCAFLDANGDELLDILIVAGEASETPSEESLRRCTLLVQKKDGSFEDFSAEAGLAINAFGMGVATGDSDNDGDLDVVITTGAGASFFLNDGTGRFQEMTATAGIVTSRWTTAAAFFDYDRDSWLDLVIVNYVDYISGSICEDGAGRRDYCGPLAFQGTVDRLYRNSGGDGRPGCFDDVTVSSGLINGTGKGLGVVCSDLTGDGQPDIYVANDSEPNRLWVQQPDGSFQDEAVLRGCAVDAQNRPQASMGTVWADLNQDGLMDLFLTHLRGETNTLYRQVSAGVFVDQTSAAGLGPPSLNMTGFGTAAADIDLDGFADLLVANGKVMRSSFLQPAPGGSHWDEYAENNQIFLGRGDAGFSEVINAAEPFIAKAEVSRGLAVGDIDNDGDLDVLVNNTGSVARLFRNVATRKGHWLTVRAIDDSLNRDAIGARIRVTCGNKSWMREVLPNSSYLSSHDSAVHFGVAESVRYDSIDVRWPDHEITWERFDGGPADCAVKLIRGSGRLLQSTPNEPVP